MKRIQVLDEFVINQIAAGEVIERPSSVVKELVENALDAGATKVEVEVAQGARFLRVSDNGSGIHPDDIKLAFSRHATSKIQTEKDLWDLRSLGFRGEALASILSISKLTCTTKTKDNENGFKATSLENGEIEINQVGCSNGTTFEINDLFYNVPARMKFLKKPATELASVVDVLQHLAIANPSVAFVCKHQNKSVLRTTGSGDLALCLGEIFSKDILNNILNINALDEKEKLFATGVITDPTFTKSNRKSIYVVVNGRFVSCPIVLKAIERAYQDKVASGRFPMAVINLLIPLDMVDVNVHPTKKEIKYVATNTIFSFIHFAVKKALEDGEYYYKREKVSSENEEIEDIEPAVIEDIAEIADIKPDEIKIKPVFKPDVRVESLSSVKDFKTNEIHTKKLYSEKITEKALEMFKPVEGKPQKLYEQRENLEEKTEQLLISSDIVPEKLPERKPWVVVGQVFNTYILLQADQGLLIVDQHIASERAIYDKLKRQGSHLAGQRLLIFEEIDADFDTCALIEEFAIQLNKWGYEIEVSKDNRVSIKQVPQIVTGRNQKLILDEIISLLEKYSTLETLEENILKTLSCHSAVRAGDVLTVKEMEKVISDWQNSDYPYTCPHGRKISHTITLKELAGYFDRQPNYV